MSTEKQDHDHDYDERYLRRETFHAHNILERLGKVEEMKTEVNEYKNDVREMKRLVFILVCVSCPQLAQGLSWIMQKVAGH